MKRGFSIIELMIVVSIIAFLAMVSVPSFKKFLSKAKRTEAHMNLNAIATAEKVYWAEHGTYSNDLQAIGWEPEGEINYTYGFPGSEGKNFVIGKLQAPASHLASAQANDKGFVAVAVADIDGDGKMDILSIDQNKKITIVQDDLLN